MSRKVFVIVSLFVMMSLVVSACAAPVATIAPTAEQTAAPTAEPTQAPVVTEAPVVDPMAQLIADAQAEGTLISYGLPDDWVNYGGMWTLMTDKYGITHADTDMSSGEILAALRAEAGAPVADITDLGLGFAQVVNDENLSQPYKNAFWDEIPDYAKDADGRWAAAYWGAIAFTVNADIVENVPQSWQDLLKPEYADKICMKDPRESATANMVVLAAAYANGGDETNPQPGLDYFKQLIDAGQLRALAPSTSTIEKGECPISLFWDFDGLSKKESLPNLTVVIPSDGTVAGLYIQFVTAGAPHANAAKLMLETEYSDEGQLAYANGFVHPIRSSVVIPDELLEKFPPAEAYEAVVFPKDFAALSNASILISDGWNLIAQ